MGKELAINIIGGLIVAILVGWFGFGGSKRVVVVHSGAGRKWKWAMAISWIMILGGLALCGNYYSQGGFKNLWFDMGFAGVGYGIILLGIGKFFHWINHG